MTNMYRSRRTNAAVNQNNAKGGILIAVGVLSVIGFLGTTAFNFIMKLGRMVAGGFGFRGLHIPTRLSLFFLLLGVVLIILGGRNISLGNRYRKLQAEMDSAPTDTLVNLAGRLASSPDKVISDIVRMQRKNFWRAVTILENAIVIEPFEEGVAYRILAEENMGFTQKNKRDTLPYPVVLLALLAIAILIPGPTLLTVILILGAVVVSFPLTAASSIFYKSFPRAVYGPIVHKEPVTIEITKSDDNAVNEVIRQGEDYLNQLTLLQHTITNNSITGDIYDITASLRQLMELLKEEPGKLRSIQQLMNYSMPTTIKLLEDYHHLSSQPVQGENIKASLAKIEQMSSMVANTFRRELDSLYQDHTLSIEVDIEVMEHMLNQDDMDITNLK